MINNQLTIYNSLKRLIRELTKHGKSEGFKSILYAVILNDLKDWAMYINPKDNEKIQSILTEYMLKNSVFQIERMARENITYRNINTPQSIEDWSRVWDKPDYFYFHEGEVQKKSDPTSCHWTIDPSCTPEVIYIYDSPEKELDINKLTVCEKMNVYIDRKTGSAWYLTEDCKWEPVATPEGAGCTAEEVLDIVKQNRGKINRTWGDALLLTIEDDGNNNIELAHETNDLEDIL